MTDRREVAFHVFRFVPRQDGAPHVATYSVPTEPGMTVLDGLHFIKENLDPTLAWRSSCRMGICGSCGMMINGTPALACNTQILEVAGAGLAIGPLPNFEVIRDLVPDLAPMFRKHLEVRPFIGGGAELPAGGPCRENTQPPEALVRYLQFSFCIKCGCCMSACPTLATDRRYLGPMPLTQAWRYNADSRDRAEAERAAVTGSGHGVFRCHYAGECSRACPKGVDPARAIQLAKRRLVAGFLGLVKRSSTSP